MSSSSASTENQTLGHGAFAPPEYATDSRGLPLAEYALCIAGIGIVVLLHWMALREGAPDAASDSATNPAHTGTIYSPGDGPSVGRVARPRP